MRPRWLALALFCCGGCYPETGACDLEAAGELVYDAEGNPAFAGQALIIQSCGNGGFCHADTLAGVDPADTEAVGAALASRLGAPRGLDFDLTLASTSADVAPEAHARLLADSQRVLDLRGPILEQVERGLMPPPGVGETVARPVYERVMEDGVTFAPLPEIGSPEGREILRSWLACRAPVVERTEEVRLPEGLEVAGYVVPRCERDCVDLRWPAIYERVIEPTCALGGCHDAATAEARLDLETGGAAGTHGRLVGVEARGRQCALGGSPPSLVDPASPDDSLLLRKIEAASSADVCGSAMPQSGSPLSAQRRCAIRRWVECGACAEADGGACAACLDAARAACGVDPASPNLCARSTPCPRSLPL